MIWFLAIVAAIAAGALVGIAWHLADIANDVNALRDHIAPARPVFPRTYHEDQH